MMPESINSGGCSSTYLRWSKHNDRYTCTSICVSYKPKFTTMLYTYKDFYQEEIAKYKTTSSKKSFLTRNIKQVEQHISDVTWALHENRWLLGERVTEDDLINLEQELEYISNLYNSL